jgi:hypothetical protein
VLRRATPDLFPQCLDPSKLFSLRKFIDVAVPDCGHQSIECCRQFLPHLLSFFRRTLIPIQLDQVNLLSKLVARPCLALHLRPQTIFHLLYRRGLWTRFIFLSVGDVLFRLCGYAIANSGTRVLPELIYKVRETAHARGPHNDPLRCHFVVVVSLQTSKNSACRDDTPRKGYSAGQYFAWPLIRCIPPRRPIKKSVDWQQSTRSHRVSKIGRTRSDAEPTERSAPDPFTEGGSRPNSAAGLGTMSKAAFEIQRSSLLSYRPATGRSLRANDTPESRPQGMVV